MTSYARPGKLFTASGELVTSQVAVLKPDVFKRVIDAIVDLLRALRLLDDEGRQVGRAAVSGIIAFRNQ